jgi:hypothetical protein
MSSKPSFSQEEIDSFMKVVTNWAKSLPKNQQAMLEQVVFRATEPGGALSEEQLSKSVGGMRKVVGEGFWAQWSARQY